MARRLALAFSLMITASVARAEERPDWVVFPVRGERPPPSDPSLLRLSRDLAAALQEALGGQVRLASRERRDELCPGRTTLECADRVHEAAGGERVLVLRLSDDLERVDARVYPAPKGARRELRLPCRWREGQVTCDLEPLLRAIDREAPPPLDELAVMTAFEALRPELEACLRAGKATLPEGAGPPMVTFRLQPDGRPRDVRIEPRTLQRKKPYGCMARLLESTTFSAFAGDDPVPFRLLLPAPSRR